MISVLLCLFPIETHTLLLETKHFIAHTGNFASYQPSRYTACHVINHMEPQRGLMVIYLFGYSVYPVWWMGLSGPFLTQYV